VFSNDTGVIGETESRSSYFYIFLRNIKISHDVGKKPTACPNINEAIHNAELFLRVFLT